MASGCGRAVVTAVTAAAAAAAATATEWVLSMGLMGLWDPRVQSTRYGIMHNYFSRPGKKIMHYVPAGKKNYAYAL